MEALGCAYVNREPTAISALVGLLMASISGAREPALNVIDTRIGITFFNKEQPIARLYFAARPESDQPGLPGQFNDERISAEESIRERLEVWTTRADVAEVVSRSEPNGRNPCIGALKTINQ